MAETKLEKAIKAWRALQPLSKDDEWRLWRKFVTDFNYNSNHIEGNTLTYGQTEVLLALGKSVGEADIRDAEEMSAHNLALRMVKESVEEGDVSLSGSFIRQLHQTMLRSDYQVHRNLPGGVTTSYTVHAGQYKTRPNSVITRYGDRFDYASPEETPAMMSDLVDWYNAERQRAKLTPAELAALFHYRFIRIHPFEDGNGRIARLLVNFILAGAGYPMLVIRSRLKHDYLEALHKADLRVGSAPYQGATAPMTKAVPVVNYFQKVLAQETLHTVDYLTRRSPYVWWYDGQRVTFRTPEASRLLHLLRGWPDATLAELADELGITVSAVHSQLERMQRKGYVLRQDSRDDRWQVILLGGDEEDE